MSYRKIASINAVIFFFFWLLVLLAGADKPPPLGFVWLILAVGSVPLSSTGACPPTSTGLSHAAPVATGVCSSMEQWPAYSSLYHLHSTAAVNRQ